MDAMLELDPEVTVVQRDADDYGDDNLMDWDPGFCHICLRATDHIGEHNALQGAGFVEYGDNRVNWTECARWFRLADPLAFDRAITMIRERVFEEYLANYY